MLKPLGVLSLGLSACLLPTFSEPNPETGGGGSTSTTGGSPNGGSATGGSSTGGSSTGGSSTGGSSTGGSSTGGSSTGGAGGGTVCEVTPAAGQTVTFLGDVETSADNARITHVVPFSGADEKGFFIVGVFEGQLQLGDITLTSDRDSEVPSEANRRSKDVFVARLDEPMNGETFTFTPVWAHKVTAPNGATTTNSVEKAGSGLALVLGMEGSPTVASRSPSGSANDLALQTGPLATPTSAILHYDVGGAITKAAIFEGGLVKAFGFAPLGENGPRISSFNGLGNFQMAHGSVTDGQMGWIGPAAVQRNAWSQPVFLRYGGQTPTFELASAWGEATTARGTRPRYVFGPGPSENASLFTLGGFDGGGTSETQSALPLPTTGICKNGASCPGRQLFIGRQDLTASESQPKLFDFGGPNRSEQLLAVARVGDTREFIVVAHVFEESGSTEPESINDVPFASDRHEYFVARVEAPGADDMEKGTIKWLQPIHTDQLFTEPPATDPDTVTVLPHVSVRPRTGPDGDENEVLLSLIDNHNGDLVLGTEDQNGWVEPDTDAQTHWLVLDAGSGQHKCSLSAGQRMPTEGETSDRVDLGLEALVVPGGTVFFGRVQSSLKTDGEPAFLEGLAETNLTVQPGRQRPLLVYVKNATE